MLEDKVRRSLAANIKSGAAADGCRYRFAEVPEREVGEHRRGFALAVAAWATAELGGKSVPRIRWFGDAGEKRADFGSETWAGAGFMQGDTGTVWLRADMPTKDLADMTAHEVLHAVKHRNAGAVSVVTEAEAYTFAARAAEQWALSDDPYAEVFVVEREADLPLTAWPGSVAFVKDTMELRQASPRGTVRSPRWVSHRQFTRDGIMRRQLKWNGEACVGMESVKV